MTSNWEDAFRTPTLHAACDGSAIRNPNGPAGWAWFINGTCWQAGGAPVASNNVMELTALLRLLESARLHLPPTQLMVVHLDSTYVRDCVTKWLPGWQKNGWRTKAGQPVKNQELIRPIAELLGDMPKVSLQWVRGHNGHPLNEAADRRARAAAEAFKTGRNPQAGPGWTLRG